MKRLLMIAYHYPPLTGTSGVQRALRFSTYLQDFGWEPIVLTAHPRSYEHTSDDQLDQIRDGTIITRAAAWDAKRHFSIGGRYPEFLARPDRWASWWLGAIPAGLYAIRHHGPAAIWSSYPIATAHRISVTLARLTGLPLIADFRDPMVQDNYPTNQQTKRSFAHIERSAVSRAILSTFTTPGAVEIYRQRYPEFGGRFRLLENGYDENSFPKEASKGSLNPNRLTIVHSGVVYPLERDPSHVFAALANLRRELPAVYKRLKLRFRAPGHDSLLFELARRYDITESVEVLPAIGYRDALEEMLLADGLLILQAASCNAQIPAKYYEYLAARRPILALTDPKGDTGRAARAAGITSIAPLDDISAISALFVKFAETPRTGTLPLEAAVAAASRREVTRSLAQLLDAIVP